MALQKIIENRTGETLHLCETFAEVMTWCEEQNRRIEQCSGYPLEDLVVIWTKPLLH